MSRVGILLSVIVGICLALAAPSVVPWLTDLRKPTVALHPEVTVLPATLRLRNADPMPWTHIRVVLNARAPGTGYTLDLDRALPPAAQEDLALALFTDREGQHFDPRTTKAYLMQLRADTPQGRGTWSGRSGWSCWPRRQGMLGRWRRDCACWPRA